MPAWSPEIANEFIRLSLADGSFLDQMQLQKLVYIAHGWHLAFSDEPLTGDRPEAWSFGPVYRRLSDALAHCGRERIAREIDLADHHPRWARQTPQPTTKAELTRSEMETIAMVYEDYRRLSASQLATLTQRDGTPWAQVFEEGAGEFRDIPHHLVRAQFVEFAEQSEAREAPRL